ncbi:MAG: Endo-1,4-beta-xylanase A precursor [Firmicutes bacterium ADurb.Bin419]|nr:MAG: Endo-1,4-beta-xylanase A precursor [Firmicutes bacterium ADurb.Bin419]
MKDSTKSSLNIKKSVYKEHPEWIKTSMSRFVVDPGIPEARAWVISRVMEVVNKYDVDGVHFDDYFYYEKTVGELNDQGTYEKYNNGKFSNIGDFRRNNTYLLVSELSKEIKKTKSWVKFGISPAGIWGNKKDGLANGSNTEASSTNYNNCFADTRKWVVDEIIDYIAPQIYFSFGYSRAAYGELATWWSDVCRGKNVHLYIGLALYKINDSSDKYFTLENGVPEFRRQLKFNTAKPEINGDIMFRTLNLNDSGKQAVVNTMKSDLRAYKALVPVMTWKGGKTPEKPANGKVEAYSNKLKLTWTDNDKDTAYYAVYRYNIGETVDITSDTSAKKLIATVRKVESGVQEFIDNSSYDPDKVFYVVTALDRLHNESSGLTISTKQSAYFSDVGISYSWAINAIDMLYGKGIIQGVGNGAFAPGRYTKRGDFTIMMVKALNLEVGFTENFKDVKADSYYYKAIGIAKELGIVKGSGEYFDPEGNITRQDMMVIMLKALEVKGVNIEKAGDEYLDRYQDKNKISAYAMDAVAYLTKHGIVNGSEGRVNPLNFATRAELAVIIQKGM